MPVNIETERQLAALADEIRQRVASWGTADDDAAVRRLVALLRAPSKEADKLRVKGRARMIATQGGRCAVCFVAFAESPPATHGGAGDRLLCKPCARESRTPPPPR